VLLIYTETRNKLEISRNFLQQHALHQTTYNSSVSYNNRHYSYPVHTPNCKNNGGYVLSRITGVTYPYVAEIGVLIVLLTDRAQHQTTYNSFVSYNNHYNSYPACTTNCDNDVGDVLQRITAGTYPYMVQIGIFDALLHRPRTAPDTHNSSILYNNQHYSYPARTPNFDNNGGSVLHRFIDITYPYTAQISHIYVTFECVAPTTFTDINTQGMTNIVYCSDVCVLRGPGLFLIFLRLALTTTWSSINTTEVKMTTRNDTACANPCNTQNTDH
jgi:hypothetical protein